MMKETGNNTAKVGDGEEVDAEDISDEFL